MTPGVSIEILDLRHFGAPMLRPVLEAECELWLQRLHWDYRNSCRLLMQYLDNRMLPGYAAIEGGVVTGYAFCVYEETKAIIGDVFAYAAGTPGEASAEPATPHDTEQMLLHHLFETLLSSPQVERIESQLLLHPSGTHAHAFREAGFDIYRRLFMVQQLDGRWSQPHIALPMDLQLRPWRDEDLSPAARLISRAYHGHADSLINDQYNSVFGSMRFLNNIVHYSGCGAFSPMASHVVVDPASHDVVALVLCSRVSPQSGHITQICVDPAWRRKGIARQLLSIAAAQFLLQGVSEISLTVTEANTEAVELYRSEGYDCAHTFDAAVWLRNGAS